MTEDDLLSVRVGDDRDDVSPVLAPTTVVIPALNATTTLVRQLAALDRQTFEGRFNVIVVDNASEDGTAAVAMAFAATRYDVRVIEERRRGINWARNAGIAAAPDGMIFLCDADDEVDRRWLGEMTRALDPGTWVGGSLDYVTLNTTRTRILWDAPERSTFRHRDPFVDETFGCNCGFWRTMWAAVGRFDSSLSGTGGDENEMFMRAYAAGYRFRAVPEAVVSYRLRPGVRRMSRQRFRQGKNQIRMQQRPGGRLLPVQHTLRSSSWDLLRTVVAGPRYSLSYRDRCRWLASVSRHLGRCVALARPT